VLGRDFRLMPRQERPYFAMTILPRTLMPRLSSTR
jgi:hypothetical protein